MNTTFYPNARAREETYSVTAQAHHAASLVAIEIEAALVARMMRGGNASRLTQSLLAVIEADKKMPHACQHRRRRFKNLGMPEDFWQEVRELWEADPRDGYSWLSEEIGGVVSGAAVRNRAVKEGWAKR